MTKESPQEAFGRELKRRRLSLDWTLEDVAARSKLTHNYLGTIENGHRDPSVSTIIAIAKAFGIRPQELFGVEGLSPGTCEMLSLFEQVSPRIQSAIRTILHEAVPKRGDAGSTKAEQTPP